MFSHGAVTVGTAYFNCMCYGYVAGTVSVQLIENWHASVDHYS